MAGAQAAGDECAPLDFLLKVYHRYGEGNGGTVIPDGLLTYTVGGTARAFVGVDRGTMGGERLAAKLIGYARFTATTRSPLHLREQRAPKGPAGLAAALRMVPQAAVGWSASAGTSSGAWPPSPSTRPAPARVG
ncbi:replication-relaxation family protein [Kitasatospora sp. GAS204B]|uniref:replication-relaxation family protein n=1 Tax=unclassified Kitasatospora TaxID=2633591 RepID=UPI002473FC22|nr:replication-relaxation family protein [Kitasatospora sp. GAS204B]MDH6122696.1 hypothetical protein [Kitasatospora sp. GAS204B]